MKKRGHKIPSFCKYNFGGRLIMYVQKIEKDVSILVVQYESLFQKVLPVLTIRKADFKMEGLKHVTEQEIWHYLVSKKWKKISESDLALHKVIADIFSLTVAQYMTFMQVEELKSANWFASVGENELQVLLGKQESSKISS